MNFKLRFLITNSAFLCYIEMRPIYNIGDSRGRKEVAKQPKQNRFEDEEEEGPGAKWYLKSVRNLINVFEQRDKEKNKPFRPNLSKTKSKSYANLRQAFKNPPVNKTKDFISRFESSAKPKSTTAIPELDAIKNATISLRTKITDSKIIDSKDCILYQNQIIALLTKIGSLESNGNPFIKEEKQKCLKIVQSCNTALKTKTGEEAAAPVALGSFVRSLDRSEAKESVSKVQILRGIFEAKKVDAQSKKPKKETAPQPKPPLVLEDEFTYTPYSEYLKRKNSEEKIFVMPKMQDTSKSCENIADSSGIRKLLSRLNDKKRDNSHYRAKSLSDIKTEDQDASLKTSAASSAEDVTEPNQEQTVQYFENTPQEEPQVKLVSVRPTEDDAEIPTVAEAETLVLDGDEVASESDSEQSDDHKHSSGFYSFVGDDSFDDTFHDADEDGEKEETSDQDESSVSTVKSAESELILGKSYYEPFNNVKCKMANGIVNITLNGVQVE